MRQNIQQTETRMTIAGKILAIDREKSFFFSAPLIAAEMFGDGRIALTIYLIRSINNYTQKSNSGFKKGITPKFKSQNPPF